MSEQKQNVELTAEEMAVIQAFRAKNAQSNEEKTYKQMVDEAINETVPEAEAISKQLTERKLAIIERFKTIISMKNDLYKGKKTLKEGRYTDTFTNSDATARITLGYNTVDNYDDTYTAGVDMVNEYIAGLASDEKSQQLADMVTTLLRERSKAGQLKAQNVLRLEKMANESGDAAFIEGMRIIRDAYKPTLSKQFVKVEVRGAENEWKPISMNMTNCEAYAGKQSE